MHNMCKQFFLLSLCRWIVFVGFRSDQFMSSVFICAVKLSELYRFCDLYFMQSWIPAQHYNQTMLLWSYLQQPFEVSVLYCGGQMWSLRGSLLPQLDNFQVSTLFRHPSKLHRLFRPKHLHLLFGWIRSWLSGQTRISHLPRMWQVHQQLHIMLIFSHLHWLWLLLRSEWIILPILQPTAHARMRGMWRCINLSQMWQSDPNDQ